MKKRLRVFISALALIITFFILSLLVTVNPATANQTLLAPDSEITVLVDGTPLRFDAPPHRIENNVMVQMLPAFEALGIELKSIDASGQITAELQDGTALSLAVGSNRVVLGNRTLNTNVPVQIINGRTKVPSIILAVAADTIGIWARHANTLIINTPEYNASVASLSGESSITIPNRRLTTLERAAWIAQYNELGGIRDIERKTIGLVNEVRRENGLDALEICLQLSMIARFKSQSMADIGYYSHGGVYGGPLRMAQAFGYEGGGVGENLYRGPSSPYWAVRGWMLSEKHRELILAEQAATVGVGMFVNEDGRPYWTMLFGIE